MKIAVITDSEDEMMTLTETLEKHYNNGIDTVYLLGYYDVQRFMHELDETEFDYVFLDENFVREESRHDLQELSNSDNIKRLIFVGKAQSDIKNAVILHKPYTEADVINVLK